MESESKSDTWDPHILHLMKMTSFHCYFVPSPKRLNRSFNNWFSRATVQTHAWFIFVFAVRAVTLAAQIVESIGMCNKITFEFALINKDRINWVTAVNVQIKLEYLGTPQWKTRFHFAICTNLSLTLTAMGCTVHSVRRTVREPRRADNATDLLSMVCSHNLLSA